MPDGDLGGTAVGKVDGGGMKARTTGCLLRVFVGESDRWDHQPLYEAIAGALNGLRKDIVTLK